MKAEGQRVKCKTCGAINRMALRAFSGQSVACMACGAKVTRIRRPPLAPQPTWRVEGFLDGEQWLYQDCGEDHDQALVLARAFVAGHVAKRKIANIYKVLRKGPASYLTIHYRNYRQQGGEIVWDDMEQPERMA